jgi:hypothetical protein
MGCTPFNWYPILKNEFLITPEGGGIRFTAMGGATRKKRLKSITKLKPGAKENQTAINPLHDDPSETFMPVFVHPYLDYWKDDVGKRAFARFVKNGDELYASRSMPFPTLNEWRGVLPNAEDVYALLDKLKNKGFSKPPEGS